MATGSPTHPNLSSLIAPALRSPRRHRRSGPPAASASSEMSRFGRSGPPPIRDSYSLLVLNITFREFLPSPLRIHNALFPSPAG